MTDPRLLNPRFAKQQYDKEVLSSAGAGSAGYEKCGPPHWDRPSWEAFKAQYGHYPFSANELPPNFVGAPVWVYELCGLRVPPISFNHA